MACAALESAHAAIAAANAQAGEEALSKSMHDINLQRCGLSTMSSFRMAFPHCRPACVLQASAITPGLPAVCCRAAVLALCWCELLKLRVEDCNSDTSCRVSLCRLAPTQGEAWASAGEDLHSRLTPPQAHARGDALPAHMAHFLASQQAAGAPQTGSMGSAQVGKCCDTCHPSLRVHFGVGLPVMHSGMALLRRDGLVI